MADLQYARLSNRLLDEFKANPRKWPKQRQFAQFYRVTKRHRGGIERHYADLQSGKSVPKVVAESFIQYLREIFGRMDVTEDEDVCMAPRPPSPGILASPELTLRAFTELFSDRDLMYMQNPAKDSIEAAAMIMDTLGWKRSEPGDAMDAESCIRRAERIMDRGRSDYARWLSEIASRGDLFRTVMFFLHKGERIGAGVVLPLKEERWRQLAAGEISDKELTIEDIDSKSPFLFGNAMSDAERSNIDDDDRSKAQASCVFYQTAYFARHSKPFRPALVLFASNDYYESVLHGFGYRRNGALLKGTEFPIMVMQSPRERGSRNVKEITSYEIWRFISRLFWLANRSVWRREDRTLGIL